MQLKKLITTLFFVCLLGFMLPMIHAQDAGDGQICVRAFEDRNSNGMYDDNEPPITQGVGVNLLDAQGITIAAKLLEDSESSTQGTVCFRQLLAGNYTVIITSPDYSATTPTSLNTSILPQSVPTRLDFGGQLIMTEPNTASSGLETADDSQSLQGILFGSIGAILVMFFMIIIGTAIYFIVFHRRLKQAPASRPIIPPSTPAYAAPILQDDFTMLEESDAPSPNRNDGSPPLFSDDTDEFKPF